MIHLHCNYILKLLNCRDISQLLLFAAWCSSKGAPSHGPLGSGRQVTPESAMDTAPTVDPIPCWPKGTENWAANSVVYATRQTRSCLQELYGEGAAASAAPFSSRCHPGVHMAFPSRLTTPALALLYFLPKLRSHQVSRVFATALPVPPARCRGSRARGSTGAGAALPALGFLRRGTLAMNKDLQIKCRVILQ